MLAEVAGEQGVGIGIFWEWLLEGARSHDPKAYLKPQETSLTQLENVFFQQIALPRRDSAGARCDWGERPYRAGNQKSI